MSKHLIFIFIHLLIFSGLSAQITFEKKFSPHNQQYGRHIFPTSDGGYLIQATIEKGWRNCYLIKTDAFGDTLWTKTYGTDSIQYYVYDMAETPDGGYVMCGDFQTVLTQPSMDSYVQKIDSSGNEIWFNLFGWQNVFGLGGGSKDNAELIKVMDDGTIIVEGKTKDYYYGVNNYQYSGYGWRSYIAKFDTAGNLHDIINVCLKTFLNCPQNHLANDIEVIGNRIFWIGSEIAQMFDSKSLVVFDTNFDTLFTINNNFSQFYELSKTIDGHILLFGTGIISKMDTLGNIIWTKNNMSPAIPFDLKELSDGSFIAIGGNTHVGVFDANFFNNGNNEVFINKYFPGGDLNWTKSYSYQPWNNIHLGYDIVTADDGGFAFTGFSNNDIWLVKTDSSGNFPTSVKDNIQSSSSVKIFPNPAKDKINIQSDKYLSSISIYDNYGKLGYHIIANDKFHETDIKKFSSGLYLIKILFRDGSIYTTKLLVQ